MTTTTIIQNMTTAEELVKCPWCAELAHPNDMKTWHSNIIHEHLTGDVVCPDCYWDARSEEKEEVARLLPPLPRKRSWAIR